MRIGDRVLIRLGHEVARRGVVTKIGEGLCYEGYVRVLWDAVHGVRRVKWHTPDALEVEHGQD